MFTEPKSLVIVQGVFKKNFFPMLAERRPSFTVVMEGRPSLNAAKTSSQALLRQGITPILIADNMAGFLFARNWVKEVWMAYRCDDGEGVLSEIGALILAVLAKRHKVPVFAYPASGKTDFLGKPNDLFYFQNTRVAAMGIKGYVPLWEWVPHNYVRKVYERANGL